MSSLFSAEFDSWLSVSTENDPSTLVEGKVSVITGKWQEAADDLVIQGVEPIVLHRVQAYGGSCHLSVDSHFKNGTIYEPRGFQLKYKYAHEIVCIGGEEYRRLNACDLDEGYTNTSQGPICSRANLNNSYLLVGPKGKNCFVHDADGTVRRFKNFHKVASCLLVSELEFPKFFA